jgi:hypothetical protein
MLDNIETTDRWLGVNFGREEHPLSPEGEAWLNFLADETHFVHAAMRVFEAPEKYDLLDRTDAASVGGFQQAALASLGGRAPAPVRPLGDGDAYWSAFWGDWLAVAALVCEHPARFGVDRLSECEADRWTDALVRGLDLSMGLQ